jgi:putative MATE family efflux protein
MDTTPPTTANRDIDTILRGHPYRAIVRLAWPATVSMLLHTLFSITNAIWVGHIGAVPVAAVISATFIVWILISLTSVLSTGVVAMISQAVGGREFGRAQSVAEETFRFALLYAVVISVVGFFLRRPLFALMHLEPEVVRLGQDYMAVYFSAGAFIVFSEWAASLFRASGNTRLPLAVASIGVTLNVVLDPLLIFGIGPFPRWGSTGAAVATAISYLVTCLVFIRFLRRNRLPFPFRFSFIGAMDWSRIGRLVMIGLPISISGIVFSVVYLFVNRITAEFGTAAVAALGIGNRIESVNYLISFGFSTAVATLVGQNIGARNPERAAQLAHKTIGLITAITGVTTALFLLFPGSIMRIFVTDPAVLEAGKHYVRILALSQILMGWEIVIEGAFAGAGNTLPPMLVAIPGAVARIPIAWALAIALGWGIDGIWWTITLTTIAKGISLYIWFSLGRWKKRVVR